MRLSFSGSLEVSAPLAVVWQRLTDPQFVAAAAPGVEKVEQVDASHFTVFSAVGLGAIRLPFHPRGRVARSHCAAAHDDAGTGLGAGSGRGPDEGDSISSRQLAGRTTMTWQSDCAVSGLLAGLGVHFLEGTARKHTEKFWLDFATRCARAD